MAKLTKAQQEVLDEVEREGSFSCYSGYKPALALIEKGLVIKKEVNHSGLKLLPLSKQAQ